MCGGPVVAQVIAFSHLLDAVTRYCKDESSYAETKSPCLSWCSFRTVRKWTFSTEQLKTIGILNRDIVASHLQVVTEKPPVPGYALLSAQSALLLVESVQTSCILRPVLAWAILFAFINHTKCAQQLVVAPYPVPGHDILEYMIEARQMKMVIEGAQCSGHL